MRDRGSISKMCIRDRTYLSVRFLLHRMEFDRPAQDYQELIHAVESGNISVDAILILILHGVLDKEKVLGQLETWHMPDQKSAERLRSFHRRMQKENRGIPYSDVYKRQYYTYSRKELIAMISEPKESRIRVLEVGCGCGATLAHIAYEWPDAKVSGIEIQDDIAKIGANYLDIRQYNIVKRIFFIRDLNGLNISLPDIQIICTDFRNVICLLYTSRCV